jgi:hypothetical protein
VHPVPDPPLFFLVVPGIEPGPPDKYKLLKSIGENFVIKSSLQTTYNFVNKLR